MTIPSKFAELGRLPAPAGSYALTNTLSEFTNDTNYSWSALDFDPTSAILEWVATVTYVFDDLVIFDGRIYQVFGSPTVGTNPPADLANWRESYLTPEEIDARVAADIATAIAAIPDIRAWDTTKQYAADEYVTFNGTIYRSKIGEEVNGFIPGAQVFAIQQDSGVDTAFDIQYNAGGVPQRVGVISELTQLADGIHYFIEFGNKRYTSVGPVRATDVLSSTRSLLSYALLVETVPVVGTDPATDTTHWDEIFYTQAEVNALIAAATIEWSPTATYVRSQVVTEQGTLFYAKVPLPAGQQSPSTDPSSPSSPWEPIAPITTYNRSWEYNTGDSVSEFGTLYIRTAVAYSTPQWDAATTYTGAAVVFSNRLLWSLTGTGTVGLAPALDLDNWNVGFDGTDISGSSQWERLLFPAGTAPPTWNGLLGAWDETRQYQLEELVTFDGRIYGPIREFESESYEETQSNFSIQVENGVDAGFTIIYATRSVNVSGTIDELDILSDGIHYTFVIDNVLYTSTGAVQKTDVLSPTITVLDYTLLVRSLPGAGESPGNDPDGWFESYYTQAEIDAFRTAIAGEFVGVIRQQDVVVDGDTLEIGTLQYTPTHSTIVINEYIDISGLTLYVANSFYAIGAQVRQDTHAYQLDKQPINYMGVWGTTTVYDKPAIVSHTFGTGVDQYWSTNPPANPPAPGQEPGAGDRDSGGELVWINFDYDPSTHAGRWKQLIGVVEIVANPAEAGTPAGELDVLSINALDYTIPNGRTIVFHTEADGTTTPGQSILQNETALVYTGTQVVTPGQLRITPTVNSLGSFDFTQMTGFAEGVLSSTQPTVTALTIRNSTGLSAPSLFQSTTNGIPTYQLINGGTSDSASIADKVTAWATLINANQTDLNITATAEGDVLVISFPDLRITTPTGIEANATNDSFAVALVPVDGFITSSTADVYLYRGPSFSTTALTPLPADNPTQWTHFTVDDDTVYDETNIIRSTLLSGGFTLLTKGALVNRLLYTGNIANEGTTNYFWDNTAKAWFDADIGGTRLIGF